MHTNLNRKHIASQVTSVGLVVIVTIAGCVTLNPIILGTVSGSGLVLKTFLELKNYKKILRCASLLSRLMKRY